MLGGGVQVGSGEGVGVIVGEASGVDVEIGVGIADGLAVIRNVFDVGVNVIVGTIEAIGIVFSACLLSPENNKLHPVNVVINMNVPTDNC